MLIITLVLFATLFTRAKLKSSIFSGRLWNFQKKKDDKITKNSKKIKEIDVELSCCIF